MLEPGTYSGGVSLADLHGEPGRPIVIAGAKASDPPKFVGGGTGLHLSRVSHLVLRDIQIAKCAFNGLNIDDGGKIGVPSRHITITRVSVSDLPKGNHDGIKLSGIDDFKVEECTIQRWGGSGIDMVGCHRGVISGSTFRDGGDNAVQAKGGSSDIRIRTSRFVDAGQRGVNLGGSTGAAYFRPALSKMGSSKYEAKNITVEGCTFVRGGAPIAFVGIDGALVRFNTLYNPGQWAIRILQETGDPSFVPCRNGFFEDNLVLFSSENWASGGVNIGPYTLPKSFVFARNFWFCTDQPSRSRPTLPTAEVGGIYGFDPQVVVSPGGEVSVTKGSAAGNVGAHALPP